MNLFKLTIVLITLVLLQSCSTQKTNVYWVSGIKIDCNKGAGNAQCLTVYKGKDIENPKWENFYTAIEGFKFEEGILKKIEVKEVKLESVPQDASSIKYTMVKELERTRDARIVVNGSWILSSFNNSPINKSIKLPELEINLNKMQFSGLGGCNNYSGIISVLNNSDIQFENIITTKKGCIDKNIEQEYFKTLTLVSAYRFENDQLILLNKAGDNIASFLKKEEISVNPRIHDIWIGIRIGGVKLEQLSVRPRLEFNLTKMKIYGDDGCNEFNGDIKEISETNITFSTISSTKKLCNDMQVTNEFNNAFAKVKSYKLDGLNLLLFDKSGKEVLAFLKGD